MCGLFSPNKSLSIHLTFPTIKILLALIKLKFGVQLYTHSESPPSVQWFPTVGCFDGVAFQTCRSKCLGWTIPNAHWNKIVNETLLTLVFYDLRQYFACTHKLISTSSCIFAPCTYNNRKFAWTRRKREKKNEEKILYHYKSSLINNNKKCCFAFSF